MNKCKCSPITLVHMKPGTQRTSLMKSSSIFNSFPKPPEVLLHLWVYWVLHKDIYSPPNPIPSTIVRVNRTQAQISISILRANSLPLSVLSSWYQIHEVIGCTRWEIFIYIHLTDTWYIWSICTCWCLHHVLLVELQKHTASLCVFYEAYVVQILDSNKLN